MSSTARIHILEKLSNKFHYSKTPNKKNHLRHAVTENQVTLWCNTMVKTKHSSLLLMSVDGLQVMLWPTTKASPGLPLTLTMTSPWATAPWATVAPGGTRTATWPTSTGTGETTGTAWWVVVIGWTCHRSRSGAMGQHWGRLGFSFFQSIQPNEGNALANEWSRGACYLPGQNKGPIFQSNAPLWACSEKKTRVRRRTENRNLKWPAAGVAAVH